MCCSAKHSLFILGKRFLYSISISFRFYLSVLLEDHNRLNYIRNQEIKISTTFFCYCLMSRWKLNKTFLKHLLSWHVKTHPTPLGRNCGFLANSEAVSKWYIWTKIETIITTIIKLLTKLNKSSKQTNAYTAADQLSEIVQKKTLFSKQQEFGRN